MKLTTQADLGLQFNEYERRYRAGVLGYLRAARKSDGGLELLNRLFRGSKKPRIHNWRDKYPDLIVTMESIKKNVQESVNHGTTTRDEFLEAGVMVMGSVAQKVADKKGITILDTYCGDMLVGREFQSRQDWMEMKLRNKVASEMTTGTLIDTQSFSGWIKHRGLAGDAQDV